MKTNPRQALEVESLNAPVASWLRRPRKRNFLAALLACCAGCQMAVMAQAPPTPIFVLTDAGALATAKLDAPGTLLSTQAITGIVAGDTLVGMDVRPQNQALYAVGVNTTLDTVQLYHISTPSGLAVAVGAAFSLSNGASTLELPATGWDIDFNPLVDRMRLVTQTGLNFRLNPNNGLPVDSDGVLAGNNPDGSINGASLSVDGTAYTNNQPNTTFTTQYTLDATTNSLYIQNPPNNGTQTSGLTITVGGTTLDFTAASGFDIEPGVNTLTSNTAVASGFGYAVLTTASSKKLYQINLTNGQAVPVGDFVGRSFALRTRLPVSIGLAVGGGSLVRFSPLTPGTSTSVALSGVAAGDIIAGIDMRPATGQIYGLGINTTTDAATVYQIDPQTGTATTIGATGSVQYFDSGAVAIPLPDVSLGYDIDFNPVVDRMRVVTGTGLNFRVNQLTGAAVDGDNGMMPGTVLNTNMDGAINGATTTVSATAYTNSFGGTTVTTQYTLDAVTNSLYIQSPPNAGIQTLGMPVMAGGISLDFANPVGFDLLSNVQVATSNTPASGDGFFVATVGGGTNVYRLNLSSGAATILGTVGVNLAGFAILSIPVVPAVAAPAVASLAPTSADLGTTVTDDGGSTITARGVVFAPASVSALPAIGDAGVTQLSAVGSTGAFTVSATGLTTGTSYNFRAYATNAVGTTYTALGTFTPPIIADPTFPTSMVGEVFNFDLDLAAGTTVTAKGLPSPLKINSTTGVITGRLSAAGVYVVILTAKGPGGVVTTLTRTLVVQAIPKTAVGTFVGHIQPDAVINGSASGRIDLTTTVTGTYSLKVTLRTKVTPPLKGYLVTSVGSEPQLNTALADGTQINLTLKSDNTLAGTLTLATDQTEVDGWRRTFDKVLNPASLEVGYYTVGLNLDPLNIGNPLVPQGTGYAAITIGLDGSTKYAGKAADGSALTGAGVLGPNGDILVFSRLYKNAGSVAGVLELENDNVDGFLNNTITGVLGWSKPPTTGKLYPGAFPYVELDVYGKYMAVAANATVIGLPSGDDPSTLDFSGAGLDAASINPDVVDAVTYLVPALKAVLPPVGSAQNPGRTTLTIKAAGGAVNGSFVLMDGTLKRTVAYYGMIIRSENSSTTAQGYFLLPQIPAAGQPLSTSDILSGKVELIP